MKKVNIVYNFDGTLTQVALPRYLILEKCNYEKGTSNERFLNELNKIIGQNKISAVFLIYFSLFWS